MTIAEKLAIIEEHKIALFKLFDIKDYTLNIIDFTKYKWVKTDYRKQEKEYKDGYFLDVDYPNNEFSIFVDELFTERDSYIAVRELDIIYILDKKLQQNAK